MLTQQLLVPESAIFIFYTYESSKVIKYFDQVHGTTW